MIKIILLLIVAYLLYRAVNPRAGRSVPRDPSVDGGGSGEIDDFMVKDPVCDAYFPRRDGVPLNHDGEDYIFCSAECRDRFIASQGGSGKAP